MDFCRAAFTRVIKFYDWLCEKLRPKEIQITLFGAGIVGLIGGLSSVIFRGALELIKRWMIGQGGSLVAAARGLVWWERLLFPTIGGLIAGVILQEGLKLMRKSSTDYMEAIALKDGTISVRATLVKSLSSLVTISSGGSIGREGAMVQLSSMLASWMSRLVKMTVAKRRLLVACGAAAGIASAYNAPIAGALFVAEIVLGSINMESFGPLIFSSVIATATVRQLAGPHPVFSVPSFQAVSLFELLCFLVLGFISGLGAPLFLQLLEKSQDEFSKLKSPVAVRLMMGGFIVGTLSIFRPEVWGNGYSSVDVMLHNAWTWDILFAVLLAKVLATCSTVGSGAVGGVFTPTLFVGAAVGCLFGQSLNHIAPGWISPPGLYALIGMGCLLSATTRAPLMAILMIFEMTLDYAIILPLMLGCVVSYYTSLSIYEKSIYSDVLKRKRENPSENKS